MTNPEEGEQSSACKKIKSEYETNNNYEENHDPLELQDPVPITFEVLKKEEKDIKEEDDTLNITDPENLRYTSTDDEYENTRYTKFTSPFDNTDCKHNITKEILNSEQQLLPEVQHKDKQIYRRSISEVTRKKMSFHQMDKKYICCICDKGYTEYRRVKYHIEAIHLGLSDYKCSQCYTTYSSIRTLFNHTRMIHSVNKLKYKCKVCHREFAHPSYLKSHSITHKAKKYECADCGWKFFVFSQVKDHVTFSCKANLYRKNKAKEKGYYFCGNCEMKYAEFHSLRSHIRLDHLGIIDYKCEQCNKIYRQSSELKIHFNSNGHKNYNKFECNYCNRKFSHLTLLKQHIVVHNRIKKYVCEDCSKRFFVYSVLRNHINQMHNKINNYQCEHCGKTFCRSNSLDQHINLVHKKLRKYECRFCYNKFQQPHHLKNHITCVHHKVKNFVCEQCGDRFLLGHHLRNHIKHIHTGLIR